jgi:hypothetical protein
MSVVVMVGGGHHGEPVSGGAMDRVVERKRIDKRMLIGGASARAAADPAVLAVRAARRFASRSPPTG